MGGWGSGVKQGDREERFRRRTRFGFPVFRFSGFPVFRFSGFPVFRFSGFPVFRFSGETRI
jgi:hypothetical protein